MFDVEFSKEAKDVLSEQVITADSPGPVLHDFQVVLDFIGPKGVEAGGKNNLFPIKHLEEVNERLHRPLRLKMKRPLLKSHPYLEGLHLLLRASGLVRVDGLGSKARLVIDVAMKGQWDALNATERYFNLLEAWLRFGRSEMVGEPGHADALLFRTLIAWRQIPKEGRRFHLKGADRAYMSGIEGLSLVALMDLFGLLSVEHPKGEVASWQPAAVHHTPFGDACMSLLCSQWSHYVRGGDLFASAGQSDAPLPVEDDEAEDSDEAELAEARRFGVWQPLFQPYFLEWEENLQLPVLEHHEGTYIFKVSLASVWRLIAIPSSATVDDLVSAILQSMKFDFDHLYEFTYRDRFGAKGRAVHPEMDEGPWADQVPIGTLPLDPGQVVDLLYDFGDSWKFTIKLERIDPPDAKLKSARVIEQHGKAPKQYANWDE